MSVGTIKKCVGDVRIDVDETGEAGFGGGLIGLTSPFGNTVQNCYSLGDVTVESGPAGGLIGLVEADAESEPRVSEGPLLRERDDSVAQEQPNTIQNSYAVGEITGGTPQSPELEDEPEEREGGLVGAVGPGVFIGTATETPSPSEEADLFIEESYWDTETTKQNDAVGYEDGIVEKETTEGLETDEMQGDSPDDGGTMVFDFDTMWQTVVAGESVDNPVANEDGYPILSELNAETQLNSQGITTGEAPGPGITVDGEDVTLTNTTFGGDE